MTHRTDQEVFWTGEFGNEYLERNNYTSNRLEQVTRRWEYILSRLPERPGKILEIGCNIGLNLYALQSLLPTASLHDVEINAKACDIAKSKVTASIYNQSIFEFVTNETFDLVFTAGVLIHIAPEKLHDIYQIIHKLSHKYVLLTEYYNPTPLEVCYRGHEQRLFKRDFAGEFMDAFPDMRLTDYGFFYHREEKSRGNDLTYFLMHTLPSRPAPAPQPPSAD